MFFKRILLVALLMIFFPTAAYAANWNGYEVRGWHDNNSGCDVYNLILGNEQGRTETVIIHYPDLNEWVRLDEGILSLGKPSDGKLPNALVVKKGEKFNPYKSYYYSIANNQLILGEQYHISPDGKWGMQENNYSGMVSLLDDTLIYKDGSYTSVPGKIKSYLLKNMESGIIEEWRRTENGSSRYYWLPNSTVLLCTFDQHEKQNVIYIYYPETRKYEKVVSGTLYAFDAKRNQILFVKNEPKRETWVMDLSTRIEEREADPESFYQSTGDRPAVSLPPNDLNIDNLKVLTPEKITQYEHQILIDDQVIPVPYIFKKDDKEFLPLRPLMEPLGITVNINKPNSFLEEFQVSYQDKKFILSENEFVNYQWQLFVTPEVLRKLGLSEFLTQPMWSVWY